MNDAIDADPVRPVERELGSEPSETRTRIVAMGAAALVEGFALIGFETWPDATEDDLETLLLEFTQRRQRALVLLEPKLARCKCAALAKVRAEGGRIVVTEVPPLHAPGEYHPSVEDLVVAVLGASALEERA